MNRILSPTLLPALLLVAACGGPDEEASESEMSDSEPMAEMMEPESASVSITTPAEGAEVEGPDVTVELASTGIGIEPAGELMDGTGHHHLFLDTDVSEPGVPVPSVPGAVIHMGDGSSSYTFQGVEPGEHRVITVVADGLHVPLQPWVVDTVTFTVH